MSGWVTPEEDVPARKRKSALPEANKVARMLRSGRTISDLAVRYGVAGTFIVQQLTSNGWDASNGKWVGGDPKDFRSTPIAVRGEGAGQACHHVGGGDNPGVVPLTPRPFTQRPKAKGFAWPEPPAGTAVPEPKPVRRSRTYGLEAANAARRKLSAANRAEIAQRYKDLESSVSLAEAFNVNQRTIRNALREQGVPIRDRAEAGRIRHQLKKQRQLASGWVDGQPKGAA